MSEAASIEASQSLPSLIRQALDKGSGSIHTSRLNLWEGITLTELVARSESLARALISVGARPGYRIGILSEPGTDWLIYDLAIQNLRGVSVPLFANLSSEHLTFEVQDCGMHTLIVNGEKLLGQAQPVIAHLESVVVHHHTAAPRPWHILEKLLDRVHAAPEKPELPWPQTKPEDLATIIYTSGSTGVPKGVEITHANLTSQILAAAKCLPLIPGKDRVLSCLPLAHIFERMVMLFYLTSRVDIYFVDDLQKVGDLIREVRPSVMTMVPRMLEKVFEKMYARVEQAPPLRRKLGQWAFNRALNRDPDSVRLWQDRVADFLVYRKLRAALGGNFRMLISGGAALSPELNRFYCNIGVPTFQGYGQTEASPVISVNAPGANRIGSVGKVLPGVEVRIGEGGEILVRGPNVMAGYHRRPEETRAAIDSDGWLHTGDRGQLSADGYLSVLGRIKELFKTSYGKYVSPLPIEQALTRHPDIDQAVVIADNRKFVCCLIFPVAKTGSDRNAALPKVVADHVARVNATLSHWEQIREFRVVPEAPSIANGTLTPTLKIRRKEIEIHYRDIIESLYQESSA